MGGQTAKDGFRAVPLVCASLALAVALMTFVGWISGLLLLLLASVRAKYILNGAEQRFLFFADRYRKSSCRLFAQGCIESRVC